MVNFVRMAKKKILKKYLKEKKKIISQKIILHPHNRRSAKEKKMIKKKIKIKIKEKSALENHYELNFSTTDFEAPILEYHV